MEGKEVKMAGIGDILAVLAYMKQKREEPTNYLGESIKEFGPQGVAQQLNQPGADYGRGDRAVEDYMKARGSKMQWQPWATNPETGEKIPGRNVYPPQTISQSIASMYNQGLTSDERTLAAKRKLDILPSAESEAATSRQKELLTATERHREYEAAKDTKFKKLEFTKYALDYGRVRDETTNRLMPMNAKQAHEFASALLEGKDLPEGVEWEQKDPTTPAEIQEYNLAVKQGFNGNWVDYLRLKAKINKEKTGASELTLNNLATITGKIRDDARSVVLNRLAAGGYGDLAMGPNGLVMQWKNTKEGPAVFDRMYREAYNEMVEEHKGLGIELPKMGKGVALKQNEHEKQIEEIVKGLFKPGGEGGVGIGGTVIPQIIPMPNPPKSQVDRSKVGQTKEEELLTFEDNENTYRVPKSKRQEFKKKHPEAKEK
jgi:hypothetical protein